MNPIDIIIVAVIVLILGAAGFYIRKAKKNGKIVFFPFSFCSVIPLAILVNKCMPRQVSVY